MGFLPEDELLPWHWLTGFSICRLTCEEISLGSLRAVIVVRDVVLLRDLYVLRTRQVRVTRTGSARDKYKEVSSADE